MSKDKSLLERAKEHKPPKRKTRNSYDRDEQELAIAWAKGEITASQVAGVVRKGGNTSIPTDFLAYALRAAILSGKLVEKDPK